MVTQNIMLPKIKKGMGTTNYGIPGGQDWLPRRVRKRLSGKIVMKGNQYFQEKL
jgi:hypothetical protein